jgi:predicted phosphodiesterase
MRWAVLADIHGNRWAFEAMLADAATVGEIDLWWCLGDLAAFGGQPAWCLAKLRELQAQQGKEKFKIIGGNTDRYLVTGERMPMPAVSDEAKFAQRQRIYTQRDEQLNWNLAQLSYTDYEFLRHSSGRELQHRVEGYGQVIGFHAIPGNDEALSLRPNSTDEEALDALLDREGRLALAGHTHLALDRTVGNWRIVNPGSVGMSFAKPGYAEWALLTFEAGVCRVDLRAIPYAVEAALAAAQADGMPHVDFWRNRLTTTDP